MTSCKSAAFHDDAHLWLQSGSAKFLAHLNIRDVSRIWKPLPWNSSALCLYECTFFVSCSLNEVGSHFGSSDCRGPQSMRQQPYLSMLNELSTWHWSLLCDPESKQTHKWIVFMIRGASKHGGKCVCRYHNILLPVKAFVGGIFKAKGKTEQGENELDLRYVDLEDIHSSEVNEILEWITGMVSGFSMKVGNLWQFQVHPIQLWRHSTLDTEVFLISRSWPSVFCMWRAVSGMMTWLGLLMTRSLWCLWRAGCCIFWYPWLLNPFWIYVEIVIVWDFVPSSSSWAAPSIRSLDNQHRRNVPLSWEP